MNIYYHKNKWKFVLIGFAMIIGFSSLFVTGTLVKELKKEERKKIKLWADATKHLVGLTGEGDYSLAIKVISENDNIPVILVVGSYLGTVSHTLSALDNLHKRNIKVISVVINEGIKSNKKSFTELKISIKASVSL